MSELNPLDKLRTEIRDHPTTLDIVSSLLDDKNIEMKTEIINPYALTTLMTIANYLKEHNDVLNHNLIKFWIDKLLKYMVSNNRSSRKEITEILKGYFTLEKEKEKVGLTSNLARLNQQNVF